VASLNRPGGNVTGVNFANTDLAVKRLELLRELVPKVATIGFFWTPSPSGELNLRELQTAARSVGQQILVLSTSSERDFEPAFATLVQQRAGGLIVGSGALFMNQRNQMAALAARHAIPAIYNSREEVEAGA
jgi:putative ABC transport system substrate-binding protein